METSWQSLSLPDALSTLDSSESGLSSEEASKRLTKHGPNSLPEPKVPNAFSIFLSQFLSPLIYILLAAAVVVFFIGETADSVIILFILLFNGVVGFWDLGWNTAGLHLDYSGVRPDDVWRPDYTSFRFAFRLRKSEI